MKRHFSCLFLITICFKNCYSFVELDSNASKCVNNLIRHNFRDTISTICVVNADFQSENFVKLHYNSKEIVYLNRQPVVDIFVFPLPVENQPSYVERTTDWLAKLSDFNSNAVWIFVTEEVEKTLMKVILKHFMRKVIVVSPTSGNVTSYKFYANEEFKASEPEEFGLGNCGDESVEFQFESLPKLWRNTTLIVKVSPFEPYADVDKEGMVAGGIEYELVKIIEKKLQFHAHFEVRKASDRPWGGRISTEHGIAYNGVLGDLRKRLAHIAIGCFYHSQETHLHFDFTHYTMQDHYHYVVPRALPAPRWKSILGTLQPLTWIYMVATLAILSLVWSILKRQNLIFSGLYFSQLLLENANNKTIKENRIPWRIIISSVLFSFYAISNVFKSEMVRVLTMHAYETQIDSLKDIIDHNISIKAFEHFGDIYAYSDNYYEHLVYKTCKDNITDLLCPKVCVGYESCLDNTAFKRTSAMVLMERYYKYYLPKRYLDEDGYPRIHLIESAVLPIYVHLFLTKGLPMYLQIRTVVSRARDCGLIARLTDKVSYAADKAMKLKNKIESQDLDYETISFAFFLWFAGLVLSLGVWILEVLCGCGKRCCVEKHYDFVQ